VEREPEFSSREIRLASALASPDLKANLNARLILLRQTPRCNVAAV